jgi:hypothetical protein
MHSLREIAQAIHFHSENTIRIIRLLQRFEVPVFEFRTEDHK